MPDQPVHVSFLDEPAARDRARSGGKAGALADLAAEGLPIVHGFVIHGDAPLEDLRDEIAAALDQIGGDAFAVRSSATAEDLEGASFAGIYDSYLNVRGVDDVLARAHDVRASLTSERARAYAQRVGVDPAEQRMGVLVQPLLDASAAGVAFTRDPLTGASDRIIINAAFGLGEGVVGGSGEADHCVTNAEASAILDRSVATKRTRVIAAAGGGIATVAVDGDDADRPALDDDEVLAVASLARQVREAAGDRDIEFALVDGVAHLLQARPITGLGEADEEAPPFPVEWEDAADAKYSWRIASRGPVPVLQCEGRARYDEHSARVFADTGVPMARAHIARWVNGYRYARPVEAEQSDIEARGARHRARNDELRLQGGSVWLSEVEPRTVAVWERLNRYAELRRRSDIEARMAHLEAALDGFGLVMGDLHWRRAGASNHDWPSAYEEITGGPRVDAGILLQALDNRTTRLIRRVRGLARIAQSEPPLARALDQRDYAPILEARRRGALAGEAPGRFRSRFRRLLADYGMHTGEGFGPNVRGDEPTWNMEPERLLDLVRSFAEQDVDALEEQERAARAQRVSAERRLRRRLANEPDALGRFDEALAIARHGNASMENHNFYMEQGVSGALREAMSPRRRGTRRAGLVGGGAPRQPSDARRGAIDGRRLGVRRAADRGPTSRRAGQATAAAPAGDDRRWRARSLCSSARRSRSATVSACTAQRCSGRRHRRESTQASRGSWRRARRRRRSRRARSSSA